MKFHYLTGTQRLNLGMKNLLKKVKLWFQINNLVIESSSTNPYDEDLNLERIK